ncbi:MAG: cysteine desulfurase [Clostridiales bacterium]|jgi:cysteine desulfurase/selenocysteine lyase|nr:cysteine desulfurase [Clostridiales bacterium]
MNSGNHFVWEYQPNLSSDSRPLPIDASKHTTEEKLSFVPQILALEEVPAFLPDDIQPSERLPMSIGGIGIDQIRADFPILKRTVDGNPLIYFDNAATTQRPVQVINRISYYYLHENANVHRSGHTLARCSSSQFEAAREKVSAFIGAAPNEIVFTRGATESINLCAQAYVKQLLNPGDEIILTLLEHHSNIVPWQVIAEEKGAHLRVATVDQTGQIDMAEYAKLFNNRTRFASFTYVSNALGTVLPAQEMIAIAHQNGVSVLIDAAQAVSHIPINVYELDVDFLAFSGHKCLGPTGIGVLYGKSALMNAARPYQVGGSMIADVTFERTFFHKSPQKFEAGTPNIVGAVGLAAALNYLTDIGMDNIAAYEHKLIEYATDTLSTVPGLRFVGMPTRRVGALSFVLDSHSNDNVAEFLAGIGIGVRAGHHCAQPIMRHFGLEATVRPSFAFYNTFREVAKMGEALRYYSKPL